MSDEQRKITVELRKAETALMKFERSKLKAAEEYTRTVTEIDQKKQEHVASLDPDLVAKLRAIGVLEPA